MNFIEAMRKLRLIILIQMRMRNMILLGLICMGVVHVREALTHLF